MAIRTVAQVTDDATAALDAAGCLTPRADAVTLVAAALGSRVSDLPERGGDPVPDALACVIDERVARRRNREPLAYIIGWCRFRGLELAIDHRALIPYPYTEPLVDIAVRLPNEARVHDVGTGSGAIALATKAERPDLIVSGSDLVPGAIEVANSNARRLELDVEFTVARGLPRGEFDLVVANLPYIDEERRTVELPPEADHLPHVAVFAGGADGLDVIREFLADAPRDLRVALEHSRSQTDAIHALLSEPETFGNDWNRFTVGLVP